MNKIRLERYKSIIRRLAGGSLMGLIIGIIAFSSADVIRLSTDTLTINIDKTGNIISLADKASGTEYLPKGEAAPVISLYKDSIYLKPATLDYNESQKRMKIRFPNGSVATVGILVKAGYLRFELMSLLPRNGVEAIVWGPFPTTLQQSIGETICVVHDNNFAIGMQALNINTIEGLPNGNDNSWGRSVIEPLPGRVLPDSVKDQAGKLVDVNVNITGDMPEYVRTYRGNAAIKKPYGSELRLFSRDRRIGRVVNNVYGKNGINVQYVEPIDVDFAGSAIALFGCPENKVLDVIEQIELNEKLPHPLIDGVWIKRSKDLNDSYLMYEGKELDKGMEYAKALDFKVIHIGEIFKNWGHFALETDRFPGGAKQIRKLTADASQKGIALGAHTLSMFTATDDPYITPVPSDSLCKVGSTFLSKEIGEDDKIIYVESPDYLDKLYSIHTVKIGKELISFREISTDKPWRLLDCKRGQYDTKKSVHKTKSKLDIIINNSYGGFYPDIHLQDTYAKRLADVCNETGLGLMDFDGMGGESPTGHGAYGVAKFIDKWYRNLDKYPLTCGAGTTHYYWHIFSFMNWGEPWYNNLRESQVNYRMENQRFFARNYIPAMLGWFNIGADYRPEEIEWIQARSAAFNAGYLLRVDETLDRNGFKSQLFEAVKEWQKARKSGAFSTAQLEKFRDPKTEFHLEKISETSWKMWPVVMHAAYEHKFRKVQTGEPVANTFKLDNAYARQPVKFYLIAVSNGSSNETTSKIRIEINNYQVLEINETLKEGDRIICDGKSVYLCDESWNKLKEIKVDELPSLENGSNEIKISSAFSGAKSPFLQVEFKTIGNPETVSAGINN